MLSKKLITVALLSSIFLSGCSLPWTKKPIKPSPTPQAQKLTPDKAPYATLTITANKKTGTVSGHTFIMNLSNLDSSQKTLEYVLLYDLPDGRQQGIPGMIDLAGKSSITRDDLLMGSCSKTCRFDEGVTKGTIELTYRDGEGNATGDSRGEWHLQSTSKNLTSVDGSFSLELPKASPGWFVTMTTLGLPKKISGQLIAGPFAITSSSSSKISGKVSFKASGIGQGASIYLWDGSSWKSLTTSASTDTFSAETPSLGTFILMTSAQ